MFRSRTRVRDLRLKTMTRERREEVVVVAEECEGRRARRSIFIRSISERKLNKVTVFRPASPLGDARDRSKLEGLYKGEKAFRLIVTDPPYGVNYAAESQRSRHPDS
jgi:hypothetical protein